MQSLAIFPLFYLPPVSYFTALKAHDFDIQLEKYEHFPKQTYRNRASIASPNGILDLTIPVVKGSKMHTPIKDVKISYDLKWQRLHWLSLQTCYRNSAYFEFYEDGLIPFYQKKFDYLFDYNLELLEWIFKQLKVNPLLSFNETYEKEMPLDLDYRNKFSSKKVNPGAETKSYFQVFSDRNEFIANLSIVDLLFNQGPQTKLYL
ncbi:WbqC family protein [Pedobacter boryungensis]|uniref:WbqC family protein n=1 Tax=Pedobacter boryungensis TaxID=869962 RepID=A0ABX2D9U3_9SPHI|nr:WbqC family protein [Pedobacter boryungensis]NQX30830.1 WbqC family protein [Pedobacter boryungensis]